MTLVSVHGTAGLTNQSFWQIDSPFQRAARAEGFTVLDDPFRWSGLLCVTDPLQWQVAASALCWYCRAHRLEAPAVACHSHGIQVVGYAAAWGQKFSAVVDVEGPVRNELFDIYAAARLNIGRWMHTWNRGDATIMAGELGEPGPGTALMPGVENLEIEWRHGHAGLLDDLAAWRDLGLWTCLASGRDSQ